MRGAKRHLGLAVSTFVLWVLAAPTALRAQEADTASAAADAEAADEPAAGASPAETTGSAESPEGEPELPPGVLAIVNGREVTIDEYVGYLLASIGKSRLDEYVNRLLLDEEARQLAVSVTPQEVEAAVEERIRRIIKSLYLGKRDEYLADLEKRHTDLEGEKVRLRQEVYYDMLMNRVVFATREVTEDAVRRQFERIYGEGGVQYVLRHLLISTRGAQAGAPERDSGSGSGSRGRIIRRSPGEARERAEKILEEIRSGLEFTQAVKQYSDDAFTKANQGRIPNYRKGFFGDSFHAAVQDLTPESPLSGVVESPRGYHIIQLVEKRTTRFEDVKDDVEEVVKNLPPSAEERQTLLERLRKEAKIQGL
jgi:hypothetical protein